jgi:cysteinyl-tRNA synthetase, unknown class
MAVVIVLLGWWLSGCGGHNGVSPATRPDYRQDMRQFVQRISRQAKSARPGFLVIPQNGQELLTENGDPEGPAAAAYIAAIDGIGREDLFYGYDRDNQPTTPDDRQYLMAFLDLALAHGRKVLVTDYCSTPAYMDSSYAWNHRRGYLSFAADRRELDHIPGYPSAPFLANGEDAVSLRQARNFLFVLDPLSLGSRTTYLQALRGTNYDLLLVDLYYGDDLLTAQEVASLKAKASGGRRLVVCYLSIGEAERYRYYWQTGWQTGNPAFIDSENPDWPGNYKVHYWDEGWQTIICGDGQSYLARILDAGFDGVYLDIIDAFEFFEDRG